MRALPESITSLARDIANAAYEDVIGARPARHRKESTDE